MARGVQAKGPNEADSFINRPLVLKACYWLLSHVSTMSGWFNKNGYSVAL